MARFSRSARICFSIEVLDRRWRVDAAQLDPRRPQAPPAGGLVQHATQLTIDLIRDVSVCSSVIPPTTLRNVVVVSCSTPTM